MIEERRTRLTDLGIANRWHPKALLAFRNSRRTRVVWCASHV